MPNTSTPHVQTVIDPCRSQVEQSPFPAELTPGVLADRLIDEHGYETDFDMQFNACIDAMAQDDAVGRTWVFIREGAELHMRHIATLDLLDADLTLYEMILFDGGNIHGDLWKHVFFPRQKLHHFVCEA